MRQGIFYWSRGIPASNMKLRAEHPLRKKIRVNASHGATWHLGENVCSAAPAPGARRCPESKGFGLSTLYCYGRCQVHAACVRLSMHSLAIIAMAEILRQRLPVELDLHSPARTSDFSIHAACPPALAYRSTRRTAYLTGTEYLE